MIELTEVTHLYRTREKEIAALDKLNLTVKEGEFVVVLGRNGSGKSTLAKHLNGLLIPTAGEVKIDGLSTVDEKNLIQIRQRVGLVFQNPDNQIVATIVEEDIAFGPENLGLSPVEIRKRVDEALDMVGMAGFSRHEPHLLSAGQKQKVAIAGVLAMKPKYLVLDEPTSMLDPSGRMSILNTLHHLNRDHSITIVHITHFTEEALEADRVVILDGGRITIQGEPREILGDVGKLTRSGLTIPPMVLLSDWLARSSVKVSQPVFKVDEMVETLCGSN